VCIGLLNTGRARRSPISATLALDRHASRAVAMSVIRPAPIRNRGS
jgi:hypothetical protein